MLVDYLVNAIVYDDDHVGVVNKEATKRELLKQIEKAYLDCRMNAPQFPAQEWIDDEDSMPFSQGNTKLPPTTYIINMGTAGLCPGRAMGTCNCCSFCYAKKAETQYKESTINRRLLQTLRWRRLTAEQIAQQLLDVSNRASSKKMHYLRINESGDVFDQADIEKMSKIADILAEHGVGTYTYSSRYDLDWSEKSKNLIVNGSGWVCDNSFIAVDEFTDDMEYQCHGDCDNCDYCKISRGINIYVEVH